MARSATCSETRHDPTRPRPLAVTSRRRVVGDGARCRFGAVAGMSAAILIVSLARRDFSDAEIASITGASRSYIRSVRSRAGIAAPKPEKRGPKPGSRPYRVGLTWAWRRAEHAARNGHDV